MRVLVSYAEKVLQSAKVLYFLRASACFIHPALLETYDKIVRDGLPKVCNVIVDNISSTQLVLPFEMGGLGVSSATLLAVPVYLASVFWCEWLSHDEFLGNIQWYFVYKSAWETVEFCKWSKRTSQCNPQKLDTTCLRQNAQE